MSRFSPLKSLREIVSRLITFTKGESRGVLLLLPLLIVVGVVLGSLNKPKIEKSFVQYADEVIDNSKNIANTQQIHVPNRSGDQGRYFVAKELFVFDPNTVSFEQLRRLGFSSRAASAIVNYRAKYSQVYELPSDFVGRHEYYISDTTYKILKPYIKISEKFLSEFRTAQARTAQAGGKNSFDTKTVQIELFRFNPNTLDSTGFRRLGFSPLQTQYIVEYRTKNGGFKTLDEFAGYFCVRERYSHLKPYVDFVAPQPTKTSRLELNSATAEQLISSRGIGELTATRIVEYRTRLGGFVKVEQLAEVEGVSEKNYEMFSEDFFVDNSKISKIDVNFASAELLKKHPYVGDLMARKILKNRQLEGGLRSIGEMITLKILTHKEAEKLSGYLVFGSF